MNTFRFSHEPLDTEALRDSMRDPACGGYTSFEGWVRNNNEGHDVHRLEYEAFEPLAVKEGLRIVASSITQSTARTSNRNGAASGTVASSRIAWKIAAISGAIEGATTVKVRMRPSLL